MAKKVFAQGMFFNIKRQEAPSFVLGSSGFRPEEFAEWLLKQKTNRAGYVNIDIMMGKTSGKPYCQLNTYGVDISDETGTPTQDVIEPPADAVRDAFDEVMSENEADIEDTPF